MTHLLREEMGFNGVIVTDALNMKAIADHFGQEEAVVMAVKAGVDIALMLSPSDIAANRKPLCPGSFRFKTGGTKGKFRCSKLTNQLNASFP